MRFKGFTAKATNNGRFGGFIGYAATFGRKPDTYGDVIAKGAFADTIRAWAGSIRPVPVFYGHNMDDPDRLITSQIDTAPKRFLATSPPPYCLITSQIDTAPKPLAQNPHCKGRSNLTGEAS